MSKPKYHEKNSDRDPHDFYPTPPAFTRVLTSRVNFPGTVHEPCCGDGAMVMELRKKSWRVVASDIVDRKCPNSFVQDAFKLNAAEHIVTNPPYKIVTELTWHFLKIAEEKVALLVRQSFLESEARYKLFEKHPPSDVVIISNRMPNSQFGHCWVVWDKRSSTLVFNGVKVVRTRLSWARAE